jgi:hypothetical protein
MRETAIGIVFLLCCAATSRAQEITVAPASVTAYSQGATSALLTFQNVKDKRPVDACWCGQVAPATPDIGFKCNEATLYGCLPVRYTQLRKGATSYTDVMSIPASVARRAYTDAASGAEATFFYVRRFVSATGAPDEFVPVTIRLGGNGAAVPFSLTEVKLSWGVDKPVLLVKPGQKLPRARAELTYTGTGRLTGRWELVKPGKELPAQRDLLPEATLPVEERTLQKRFTQLSRFNIFLAPGGKFVLPGPEGWRVESHIDGMYLLLLRIEAVYDQQSGDLPVASGAVAGFSLPVLRYYVGSGSDNRPTNQETIEPTDNAILRVAEIEFRWPAIEGAAFYRIEIEDSQGKSVLSAILLSEVTSYKAPSWLKQKRDDGRLRWRVIAFDRDRNRVSETTLRYLSIKDGDRE